VAASVSVPFKYLKLRSVAGGGRKERERNILFWLKETMILAYDCNVKAYQPVEEMAVEESQYKRDIAAWAL